MLMMNRRKKHPLLYGITNILIENFEHTKVSQETFYFLYVFYNGLEKAVRFFKIDYIIIEQCIFFYKN